MRRRIWRALGAGAVLAAVAGPLATSAQGSGASTEPRIILVAGNDQPPVNDRPITDLLTGLGSVEVVADETLSTADLDAELIVVSSSVDPTLSFGRLRNLAVPVITWEPHIADALDLALEAGETRSKQATRSIAIADPAHPLADGYTGDAYVFRERSTLSWVTPGPGADVVATVAGNPDLAAIYAYDAGRSLVSGSPAPSCRVGLFPTWTSSALLSSIGDDLVSAAVEHALACDAITPIDADGDGHPAGVDCDDHDPTIHPGAPEVRDDGIDQDCDGRDAHTPSGGPVENVVVILTDDMNYTELQHMPKTNALLVGEGVAFDDAHQNTPLCCPARATLLTGQRSKHHGVNTNKPEDGEGYIALDHGNTLATWFEDAGYATIHIGKYLNGYGQDGLDPDVPDDREVPPGWTDWQTLVGNLKYYDYTINDNGELIDYGSSPDDYQTDVLAHRATAAIRESVDAERPFFLMVSTQAPHTYNGNPPEPAPRHEHLFDDVDPPRPPNLNEQDRRDKPPYVRKLPNITKSAQRKLDAHWENQVESLQAVDDLVEEVYDTLAADGVLDETLIVFMSDNGYMFGEHRLIGKVRPYEESTHVPLVMRGGPFVGGAAVDHVVSSTDVAPTIVGLTGIMPGLTMDGIDLSGVLDEPATYDDRAIIIEMVDGPGYDAVRTERWLWIEYYGSARELYDLDADPYQLDSKHKAGGRYKVARNELSALLGELRSCVGTDCIKHSAD